MKSNGTLSKVVYESPICYAYSALPKKQLIGGGKKSSSKIKVLAMASELEKELDSMSELERS